MFRLADATADLQLSEFLTDSKGSQPPLIWISIGGRDTIGTLRRAQFRVDVAEERRQVSLQSAFIVQPGKPDDSGQEVRMPLGHKLYLFDSPPTYDIYFYGCFEGEPPDIQAFTRHAFQLAQQQDWRGMQLVEWDSIVADVRSGRLRPRVAKPPKEFCWRLFRPIYGDPDTLVHWGLVSIAHPRAKPSQWCVTNKEGVVVQAVAVDGARGSDISDEVRRAANG
jgi:hypothetical protein